MNGATSDNGDHGAAADETSIVLSTFNQPGSLWKTLLGYSIQDMPGFEIVIADDGSSLDTQDVINQARRQLGLNIVHLWQPDRGFRKCRILNKAILKAGGSYLVFSDGDCIPRPDFVRRHLEFRRPGHFLSGGYIKLPLSATLAIRDRDVLQGHFANRNWLIQQGLGRLENLPKLTLNGRWARIVNRVSRTRAGWHGHNASCWKSDALLVNGFDERMGWGGEDREFGVRLVNAGIRAIRIRYSAICVHLYHGRPWKDDQVLAFNDRIREHSRRSGAAFTAYGISRLGA